MTNLECLKIIAESEENPFICKNLKTQYHGEWVEICVAINNDHTAQIRMTKESYDILMSQ